MRLCFEIYGARSLAHCLREGDGNWFARDERSLNSLFFKFLTTTFFLKKFLAIVDRDKTSAHFEFRISLYVHRERETFAQLSPSVHPPCAGFRHDRIDDGALYRLLAYISTRRMQPRRLAAVRLTSPKILASFFSARVLT